MLPEKPLLKEVALDAKAIKTSRSEEIQIERPDTSMTFIRNFILGIPFQEVRETAEPEQVLPEQHDLDHIKKLAGIR
jgi:hypothetical protein